MIPAKVEIRHYFFVSSSRKGPRMKGTRRVLTSWSISRKLLLLLLLIFLPASAVIIASGLHYRWQTIQEASQTAQFLVQSLAAQQEQIAYATKQTLYTLAQLPEVRKFDDAACKGLFHELTRKYPIYSVIAATRPDGSI